MTVATPTRAIPWTTVLPQNETKVGRALTGGHLPSIVKNIIGHEKLRELLFKQFVSQIDAECTQLCRRQPNSSAFRKIPQSLLTDFSWNLFIEDLQSKAPLFSRFYQLLLPMVITEPNKGRKCTQSGYLHGSSSNPKGAKPGDEWCAITCITSFVYFTHQQTGI